MEEDTGIKGSKISVYYHCAGEDHGDKKDSSKKAEGASD